MADDLIDGVLVSSSSSSLTDAEVDELAEKVGWRLEEGNGG